MCFLSFIDELKPDVVHVQETLCLPLDLVSELRARGHAVMLTAQDYSAVCPTITLFRHDQQICPLRAHELQCHLCVRELPSSHFPTAAEWANPLVEGMSLWARAFGPRCDGHVR